MDEVIENINNDSSVGCITINGVEYATGIIWNRASFNSASQKKIIKDLAASLDTNLICYANHSLGKLYGLADARLGHKKNMPSLALRFERASDKSLLGVWCVGDDSYWFVLAINNDGVIVLDKAYKREDGALAEFYSLFDGEWNSIHCPEHWGVPGSVSTDISSLFICRPQKIKKIKLGKDDFIKLGAVFAASVLIFALVLLVLSMSRDTEQEYFIENESEFSDPVIQDSLPIPESPLKQMLTPEIFIKSCVDSIQFYRFYAESVPGWAWSGIARCDGKSVDFNLTKNDGTVLWLEAIKNFPNEPNLSNLEERGMISWEVEVIDGGGNKDYLPPSLSDNKKYLSNSFSELSVDIEFYEVDLLSYWKSERFRANIKYEPKMFIGVFSKAYGVILTSIEYSFVNDDWIVEGRIYSDLIE